MKSETIEIANRVMDILACRYNANVKDPTHGLVDTPKCIDLDDGGYMCLHHHQCLDPEGKKNWDSSVAGSACNRIFNAIRGGNKTDEEIEAIIDSVTENIK